MENESREEAQQGAMDAGGEGRAVETPAAVDVGAEAQAEESQVHRSLSAGNFRGPNSFDMAGVRGSLPSYPHGGPPQVYSHQMRPVANQTPMYPFATGHYTPGSPNFPMPYTQQVPVHYQGQRVSGVYQGNVPSGQHLFPNQMYVPAQVMMPGPAQAQYQQLHSGQMYAPPQHRSQHLPGTSIQPQYGYRSGFVEQSPPMTEGRGTSYPNQPTGHLPSNTIRGPPRKPKQSGHALWVGNLPPGANIVDLKDHFSRDATDDIESVFLISKSNCAFVNYKTEQSCTAAMARFHDSRFHGVRLVCRLRRGSAAGAPAASLSMVEPSSGAVADEGSASTAVDNPEILSREAEPAEGPTARLPNQRFKERFFVIKSLTIEDLSRSVQSGVWATQSHNEAALNEAYKSADNVYLIFSANKSGQYFGYARMDSAIDDESAASIVTEAPGSEQKLFIETQTPMPAILPLTIPTVATTTAPKGRIIDDSARGTIFWEADQEEEAADEEEDTNSQDPEEGHTGQDSIRSPASTTADLVNATFPAPTTYGKPFKITWKSTDHLPFYRTRGLRNPWNTNREVKIARDGTEIEPTVGRRLVDMFGTPAPAQPRSQGGYGHPAVESSGLMPGYQPPGYGGGVGGGGVGGGGGGH